MKILFNKYPIDIILCMLWSIILLPIALLNIGGIIRIILGLPFILFIPGYILIVALFPTKKTNKGMDITEKIALSFGLSIVAISLVGLALNYTPWEIQLKPILISIFIFIISVGSIAIYRWFETNQDERFNVTLDLSMPKSENKLDKALTIILAACIIIALASFIYIVVTPRAKEKFTELYLLNKDRKATDYPKNLINVENASVIIGLINHEYETIDYTIEIWLINQTMAYNESTDKNVTIYHHMWFMDKIKVTLNHTSLNMDEFWKPQWEYIYTFTIKREGTFKLAFLLYTKPTEDYDFNLDYKGIADQKIESAYRENHLWIDVTFFD